MKYFLSALLLFPFLLNAQTAFISGNDSICDNSAENAEILVSFNGLAPFNFNYAINGMPQLPIITDLNPFIILSQTEGVYTIDSFSDASGNFDSFSGSGLVTILESPDAIISILTDTLSVVYPFGNFNSESNGNIISWEWNFGDNTVNQFSEVVLHEYKDSVAIYQTSLIITDTQGCTDTATKIIWINNDFWIYVPNSFTPDNDKFNDKFCIEYNGIREDTFIFQVYNSKGEMIFNTDTPTDLSCSLNRGWNGKNLIRDEYYPIDNYTYEMFFKDLNGWKHQKYGTINLIR